MREHDLTVLVRCLAPLSHGAFGESAGNATLVRRMPIVSLPGMPRVPCVSGNALRGVLRRAIMRDLLARCGLDRASLPAPAWDRLYAALANGGHLETSETGVDPDAIRELRASLPPLSALGAALYSWMLPGHLSVGILWPACAETVAAGLVLDGPDPVLPAEDLVHELSHVRHVDREHQSPELSGVTPMPTTMEALATGTRLESRVTFARHATALERGAVAHGLSLVRALGGRSGSGLGSVDVDWMPDHEDQLRAYLAWLAEPEPIADRLRRLAVDLGRRPRRGRGRAETDADADAADADADAADAEPEPIADADADAEP
jgi:hypothetical protein